MWFHEFFSQKVNKYSYTVISRSGRSWFTKQRLISISGSGIYGSLIVMMTSRSSGGWCCRRWRRRGRTWFWLTSWRIELVEPFILHVIRYQTKITIVNLTGCRNSGFHGWCIIGIVSTIMRSPQTAIITLDADGLMIVVGAVFIMRRFNRTFFTMMNVVVAWMTLHWGLVMLVVNVGISRGIHSTIGKKIKIFNRGDIRSVISCFQILISWNFLLLLTAGSFHEIFASII